MVTDYDSGQFAELYQETLALPFRSRVEAYSFRKLIGDVRGKQVLDAACGDGHYSRILRRAGAARVIGIDIAERMIALARDQEAREPLGIEYAVEDAQAVVPRQDFDLVVAAWLLCHARDRAELLRVCAGLASRVKPGGRFVTLTTNPDVYRFRPLPDYRKYGYKKVKLADDVFDGAPIEITLDLGDSTIDLLDYYLPIDAYESAFRRAGFRDFTIHMPELEPSAEDEGDYWDDLLAFPTFVLMDCAKA